MGRTVRSGTVGHYQDGMGWDGRVQSKEGMGGGGWGITDSTAYFKQVLHTRIRYPYGWRGVEDLRVRGSQESWY